MRGRFDVRLDRVSPESVDPCVLVTDVRETAPTLRTVTADPGRGEGTRLLYTGRSRLDVTVTLAVRERDPARRAGIISRLAVWAGGSTLTLNTRPGRRLPVVCTRLPAVGSSLDWSAGVELVLTAFASPWWEAEWPVTAENDFPATSGSLTIKPVGTAVSCPMTYQVTNESGENVNLLTIACGDSVHCFDTSGSTTALIPNGKTLTADCDGNGLQRFLVNGASRMAFRTADSTDEILLTQRAANTVTFSADRPVTVRLSARARDL